MPNDFNSNAGYRGNKQLKLPNACEFVDPQTFKFRMEELEKISNDISYFAEKYFHIISLDKRKNSNPPLSKTKRTNSNNGR